MELEAEPSSAGKPALDQRPAVSVVIPFAGDRAAAQQVVDRFRRLELGPADEIVVGDNSTDGVFAAIDLPPRWSAVPARGEGSPPRARNAGALAARGDWLLFVDSDCVPEPALIQAYFADPIDERSAIVAGRIAPLSDQSTPAALHAATRGRLDQRPPLAKPAWRWAHTANMLVRRRVWQDLGGFLEGIRNAEDVDFCWRAQHAGWSLAYNERAAVEHAHRETLADLWRQSVVAAASGHWVHRRWPDAPPPQRHTLRRLARAAVAAPAFLVTGRPRRALLKLYDAVLALAPLAALAHSNRAATRAAEAPNGPLRRPLQIWVDSFPVLSETFVTNEARALRELGHPVEVVATRRPDAPALGVHDLPVRYLEDDTRLEQLGALARLVARHPLRVLAELLKRPVWRRDEQVVPLRMLAPAARELARTPAARVHAHFAAGAALAALRVNRILGREWSLTAHAYDIYQHPRNLRAKLEAAALVTTGCEYNVRELRRVAGPRHAAHVHEIVMGVDPERFRRTRAHERTGTVIAIGRLVEKKGFADLLDACARPELDGLLHRLVIVGEGPLGTELAARAGRLGLGDRVQFAGRLEPGDVASELERADVLAMPSVVARDGDRDSMPLVVKEALAMEVPVVVTDEVGLPELARPEFARVVPPRDPAALAAGLAELLARSVEERAAMGSAGRAFVERHAELRGQTARLSAMLERLP